MISMNSATIVMAMFPQLLIAKAVDKAAKILNSSPINKSACGLNMKLELFAGHRCRSLHLGRHLSAEEKQHLKMYFNYLPLVICHLYQNFIAKTRSCELVLMRKRN